MTEITMPRPAQIMRLIREWLIDRALSSAYRKIDAAERDILHHREQVANGRAAVQYLHHRIINLKHQRKLRG